MVLTRMPGRASRMPEGERLAAFAETGATLAIHLAIQSLGTMVDELTPILGADCPVAVVVARLLAGRARHPRDARRHCRAPSPPSRSSARR